MTVYWDTKQAMEDDLKKIDFNEIISLNITYSKINLTVLPPKLKSLGSKLAKHMSDPMRRTLGSDVSDKN